MRREGTPGLMLGVLASFFAILGLLTIGVLFIPFAALFAVLGLLRASIGLSATGFVASLIGLVLTFVATAQSPSMWVALAAMLAGAAR